VSRVALLGRMAAFCAVAVLPAGCATVWTRGLVQDTDGAGIPAASVRALDERGATPVFETTTDRNGCFMLGPAAARGRRHFVLEIVAPGYERAAFDFDLQTPILFVRLVTTSSGAPSDIRPATYRERAERWEPLCAPPMPPGAEQLSP